MGHISIIVNSHDNVVISFNCSIKENFRSNKYKCFKIENLVTSKHQTELYQVYVVYGFMKCSGRLAQLFTSRD